jgi:hypothetical protein
MEAAGRAETVVPVGPAPVTRAVRRTKLTGKPVALCAGATRLARLCLACRGTIALPRNPIHAVPRTQAAPIRPTSWEADRCAGATPRAPGSIARRETTAPTRRRCSADHRKTERTKPTSWEADRCAAATPKAPGFIARRETTAPTRRRCSADHRKTERTKPTSWEADRCAAATPKAPACTVDPAARASTPRSSCVVSLPLLRQNHSGTTTLAGFEPVFGPNRFADVQDRRSSGTIGPDP